MKVNPEVELGEDVRIDDSKKGRAVIDDLVKRVRSDETDMSTTWAYHNKMWSRYYSRVNREVNYPYPGAANIVDPLSYKHGTRLQPTLLNLLTGGPRWVTCRPRSAMAFRNKPNIEILMDGLLRGGGRHALPDFEDQISYGTEAYCWSGNGVWANFWDFQTRVVSYTLRKDALPGRLSLLVIMPGTSPGEIARMSRVNPGWLESVNPEPVKQWLGARGITQPIIPSRDWTIVAPVLREEVIRMFGLDMEDKDDKKAVDVVMDWLRSGTRDKSVTIKVRKVLRDCPNIASVSPFELILPDGAMSDFSQLDRLTRKFYLSTQECYQRAEDGRWDSKQLDLAMDGGGMVSSGPGLVSMDPFRQGLSIRRGTSDSSDTFEFYETYALVNLRGTRMPEMARVIWESRSGAILHAGEYCARHGKIPFVCAPFEYAHPAFDSSRGLPQVLEDAELYNTAIKRHILNNAQSASCTMFSARRSQWLDPETITPMPNLVVEVEQQGDFAQIPMTTNTLPLERAAQMLETWPEEIVGTQDIAATQNPRLFEPRTRFEVERVASNQANVVGKRGRLFCKRIGHLYSMILSLYQQYGPEQDYIERTGDSPMRLTQSDIMGECDVVPVAAVGEMDPNFRQQKAQARVQMAIAAQPYFANSPDKVLNIPNLVEDAFNEDDPLAAKRAIQTVPQEQMQQNIMRLQQEAAQSAKYRDVAMRLMAGAPVGVDEMKEVITETGKLSSMKKLQPIMDNAAQAQAAINRMAASGQMAPQGVPQQ